MGKLTLCVQWRAGCCEVALERERAPSAVDSVLGALMPVVLQVVRRFVPPNAPFVPPNAGRHDGGDDESD